ncbi:MAG: hypothetical protein ACOX2L_01420 [Anaerolineae bacterium]|jgi:hypothetical protein|nr:hypothetical protein [Chloroflexota bacterium]
MSISETTWFERPGPANTAETLRLAGARAEALGINDILIASNTGESGLQALQALPGRRVIVVGSVFGFSEPNRQPMSPEMVAAIEGAGGRIVQAGHAFGMLGRAVNRKFNVIQVDEIIAHVLRLFSAGVKVGCEIACMACDAGLVRPGAEVIAIGGTGRGADTAVVLRATNTHTFFDLRVLEIICKPRG